MSKSRPSFPRLVILAVLPALLAACSVDIDEDVVFVLDPEADNTIALELPNGGVLQTQLFGGFEATLQGSAGLGGADGQIAITNALVASGPLLGPIPLCVDDDPDLASSGSFELEWDELGQLELTPRLVAFAEGAASRVIVPLPISETLSKVFDAPSLEEAQALADGGGPDAGLTLLGGPIEAELVVTVPDDVAVFGGSTVTAALTLIPADELPQGPELATCSAFLETVPTHFLSAGPEKELTLRDGTEVEEGQLFTWDQRAGEAVSLPDFEEKVSAAHVFADTGVVWFVSEDNFDIGNQEFDEGDVVAYDPDADRYDLVRAGADLLDGVIDALYVAPDGTWLYSSDDETDTEGNGIEVLRGDIVRYDPSSDEHSVEIPAAALFDDDPDDANVVGLTVADGVLYFTMEDEGEVGGEAFVPGDVLGVQLDAVPQPAGRSLQVLAADRMIADEEALGALGLFVPRGWEPGLTPLP